VNPKQKQKPMIDPRLVQALAHPLRVEILAILSERVASPNHLSVQLETDLTHVAYHTRTLNEFGCLTLVDTRQRRGATEHFYRARPGTSLTWMGLDLDERGWSEVAAIMAEAGQRVLATAASSRRRLNGKRPRRKPISAVAGLLSFETAAPRP
jgi:DNA-binding transcriptional ArsR family regulator